MGTAFLYGNGGGIKLPFRVIGGTTQPSNPKDGDIWVKTSVPIMRTEFANGTWASGGVGLVFLAGTLGGSNPTGTNTTVWAINKNTGTDKYILKITLTGCKQVQGSKGNWVNLDAYRYYGGKWVQFSSESVIPEFTYTGDYEIVNDADETITVSPDNWKIRFLTSGTLTFQALNGAENGIDVFLVGGGGGGGAANGNAYHGGSGGGGGYVSTQKNVSITAGTSYSIVIGAGGSAASASNGGSGGETKAFGYSASGGSGGRTGNVNAGGSGGSGGGGGSRYSTGGTGGSNGSDGSMAGGSDERGAGGSGSGITTREFGDSSGRLYSGGGGGGSGHGVSALSSGGTGGGGDGGSSTTNPTNGTANTGGGGGGSVCSSGNASGAAGGSGIVVIRNKR